MTHVGRGVRAGSAALLLSVALAACGTEIVGSGGGGGGGGGSTGGGAAVDRAELKKRAGESALEHVYVTEIPGFTLAAQSVGVIGDDGYSGTYVSKDGGGRIQLSVERGKLPADGCVGCEKDGANWYSSGTDGSTYRRAEDGHVVRLTGSDGADRATLKAAAEKAHRASPAEMDAVLPEARGPDGAVVERGDLPPVGDGAPRNDVGASG